MTPGARPATVRRRLAMDQKRRLPIHACSVARLSKIFFATNHELATTSDNPSRIFWKLGHPLWYNQGEFRGNSGATHQLRLFE